MPQKPRSELEGLLFGAIKVDPIGQLFGDALNEYEFMLHTFGDAGVSNRLLARAKNRDDSIDAWKGMTIALHLMPIAVAPRIYVACDSLLESGDADKVENGELWVTQLQAGVRDVMQSGRLLMAGQAVGAAAVARYWLDRWTVNLSRTNGLKREADEHTDAFYQRVWSRHTELKYDIGRIWKDLSDLLHGVGSSAALLEWNGETDDLLGVRQIEEAVHVIGRTQSTILLHIKKCIVLHAIRVERPDVADLLSASPPKINVSHRPTQIGPAFWPLTPAFLEGSSSGFVQDGADKWKANAAAHGDLSYSQTNEDVWNCLLYERARVHDVARYSYDLESKTLGEAFRPDSVTKKLERVVLIAEMAEACAAWDLSPKAAAGLRLAAGAIKSAFALWAEDDNLSLMCLRSAIQGLAYSRVVRIKPEVADKLTAGNRPPAQWIKRAGWARLDAFTSALTEFSHIGQRSRYSAALAMLNDLQAEDWEHRSPQTARGHAVFAVLALAAEEVSEVIRVRSSELADSFDRIVTVKDWSPSGNLDQWMDRISRYKSKGLGEPDDMWLEPAPLRYGKDAGGWFVKAIAASEGDA